MSPVPSCSKTPLSAQMNSTSSYNSPVASYSKKLNYNETLTIKNFSSNNFSPLTSTAHNLKNWNPLGNAPSGGTSNMETGTTRPLFSATQALLKADQVLAECLNSLDERTIRNENGSKAVPSGNKVSVDSDDDICASKNSGDDVRLFDDDKSLIKDTAKSSAPNNFFDNICPDLLESAQEMSPVVPHAAKRKRSAIGSSSSSENGDEKIKKLLKEKAAEIERKKKAAVERRRMSLLQRSANR